MNAAIAIGGVLVLLMLLKISGTISVDLSDDIRSVDPQVKRIAEAIARAEGFFTDSTLLQSLNNPVGLKLDGKTLTRFDTLDEGWSSAYRQVKLILANESSIYNRDMTIAQIAPIWTGNDRPEAWASIVSKQLGVDSNTAIKSV